MHGIFHGTSACLSALYRADRYQEIVDLLVGNEIWPYEQWAVKALAALGRKSEAIRYAESCRGQSTNDTEVSRMCQEILLSSGLVDEAYRRYGLQGSRVRTYVGTFRAVAKKYPHKSGREILHDSDSPNTWYSNESFSDASASNFRMPGPENEVKSQMETLRVLPRTSTHGRVF